MKRILHDIGKQLQQSGRNAREAVRQRRAEMREYAEELYGEAAPPAVDTPPRRLIRPPLPGSGWIRAEVPRKRKSQVPLPGVRNILLSHVIVPENITVYTEKDPHPYNITDPNVRRLKRDAATAFQPFIFSTFIKGNFVSMNLRPFQTAYLPREVYEGIARCIFGVSEAPEVQLLIDSAAPEAADLHGLIIPRSIFEPPTDPAAST